MNDLHDKITALSPEKRRALLEKLQQNQGKNTILSQSRESNLFPLSFAQQRLWFLQQLEPENSFYHISGALRLVGDLDLPALEASVNLIIQRHESLRTNFIELDGEPKQVIKSELQLEIPVIECNLDEIESGIERECDRPFNLATDPLIRVALLRLAPTEWILTFTMHHIISDGWSLEILVQELAQIYGVLRQKQSLSLPELPIQYADFTVWQREWLQGDTLKQKLNYWQQQLANAPPLLELPSDRIRPRIPTFAGAEVSVLLNSDLTADLQNLSRQENVTLFMLLLTAFQILLHRYTNQTDILVGSPIANRNRVELEGIMGFLVNTLVFRTNLSGNPTFREVLARVRQNTLEAYAHQDLPFEKLVEELHIERNLSYNPLFQVMFQFQNVPSTEWELPGLTISSVDFPTTTAQFDLTLNVAELEEGLRATFEYSTDLFDEATINRILEHFQILLAGIVAHPAARISELPIMLEIPGATLAELAPQGCILDLIKEQTDKTPDNIAIIHADRQLTYRELAEKSDRLAAYLQSLGVGAETLVGICLERSSDMVIGLLGILKVGGAYLPLDPAHPAERLSLILEDAGISLLLTQEDLVDKLSIVGVQRIAPLQDSISPLQHYQTPNPSSLAYTIYTSGSTGKPKGVQISHGSLFNFIKSLQQLELIPQDRLLSVTTISFDIAALEIFLPLTVGASVEIVSRDIAADGWQLAEKLVSSGASIMQATPATWKMLLAAGWEGNQNLKILCGGEALTRELADSLLARGKAVWNLYGPTETTIWSTIWQVNADRIKIGQGIANTEIYILDSYLNPVPVGVTGDLYLGGAGLARGYLNRPELTAEKFIPHPFSSIPGARLYQTGDLARYLVNGEIECLGRSDRQVKIRGFRIELGEIEARLAAHPDIKENIVVLREETPENQFLVAYFISNSPTPYSLLLTPYFPTPNSLLLTPYSLLLTPHSLRSFLQQHLPEYAIPAYFVELAAFPLTPNGKIDKRHLPAPDIAPQEPDIRLLTPLETAIQQIWVLILGREEIGINENFFTIGGHSLLATQAIARLRQLEAINGEIPLRWLFEYPTIAQLAAAINANLPTDRRITAPTQRRSTATSLLFPTPHTQHPIPLSFAQKRLWFIQQLAPDSSAYNLSSHVKLIGNLDITALERSFQEVIWRHQAMRTSFALESGNPVQIIAPQLSWQLPIIDLQDLNPTAQEAEVWNLATESDSQPFHLTVSPLWRVSLLQLDSQTNILLLTMHHIISDGWSMGVLLQELTEIYQAFCQGLPSPVPELPIQYADFAIWQHQHLHGEILESHLNYWKRQLLGGNLPPLKLSIQQTYSDNTSNAGASHSLPLSVQLSQELQQFSDRENVTPFMTLLAAFQLLLHCYSQQDDIVVGTDIANRTHQETEQLIGFFVNLLVLRADMRGNLTFRQLLQQVRQTTLEAYAHQDLPFDKLVEELQPERKLHQTPLFQVLFVLQNTPNPEVKLTDLELQPVEITDETSKFDLALFIIENEGKLELNWQYKTSLFESSAIAKMAADYAYLLNQITNHPDRLINSLEMLPTPPKPKASFSKFKTVKPQAVSFNPDRLVKFELLPSDERLPLVFQPQIDDLDLAEWAKNNRELIQTKLLENGGILFRNFGNKTAADFENFAQSVCPQLFGEYGDLPRETVSNKVYSSTPYPNRKTILFHNESSHLHRYPMKIWFGCIQPAASGGETPIIDCRQVYRSLNPQLRQIFAEKHLLYVRNYTEGLDVSWQNFFQTEDPAVVETYCRQNQVEFEWHEHGLRTREIRPAISRHPQTKEMVFFNQIFLHHSSCLDPEVRESLLCVFGEDSFPRQVYFGDGSAIADEIVEEISAIYRENSISFSWQKGDILMLDNMLAAHSRSPYTGSRKIVVSMGDIVANQLIPNHL
ncbi:non-ribosomal peptide synthetase [Merismopedia glauca]|uniref:Non-ribosomal peptide synthetase n=1 Tax=Merismopedia glauca CCAP 1448/3 TaxID=1296344 RepID=A0A2T1C0R4_9CYAN|nr:non-ribosomal peptide synthetase [Merismopedia glauca]PSB01757.1 non-ribosomal peptide synthetase [Merismopedia glauca CCAP 1448/3]